MSRCDTPTTSRPTRSAAALLAAVALGVAITGCSTSTPDARPSGTDVPAELGSPVDKSGQAEITIDVGDNTFDPKALTVSPGTKMTFVNKGANVHNVTPNHEGDFPAINLPPGASGTVVAPPRVEVYGFYCTIHGGLTSGQHGAFVVTTPG